MKAVTKSHNVHEKSLGGFSKFKCTIFMYYDSHTTYRGFVCALLKTFKGSAVVFCFVLIKESTLIFMSTNFPSFFLQN